MIPIGIWGVKAGFNPVLFMLDYAKTGQLNIPSWLHPLILLACISLVNYLTWVSAALITALVLIRKFIKETHES